VTTAQKKGPDEEKSEFESVSNLTLRSQVKVTGATLPYTVKSDKLMNIHAKYQWPKSNNKKVVDLRVQNMLLNVTLIFYFKVKLFIIGKENIPFLGML
jgi:hypothetical protein